MKTSRIRPRLWAGGLLLAGVSGCVFEGLFAELADTDHLRPRTTLLGTVEGVDDLTGASFEVLLPSAPGDDNVAVEIFEEEVSGNTFNLSLAEGSYTNARLRVSIGERSLLALVPEIADVDILYPPDVERGRRPTEITVSADTTYAGLVVLARLAALDRGLSAIDPAATESTLSAALELSEEAGSLANRLRSVVETLVDRTDPTRGASATPVVFQWPSYVLTTPTALPGEPEPEPEITVETPAIVEGTPAVDEAIVFVEGGVPVVGDSARGFFDTTVGLVSEDLIIQECPDPDVVRTLIVADYNQGKIGGSGGVVSTSWVAGADIPGKQMFFVGGIVEESPIQDPELDAALGNPGAWTPNRIPMFDDGTNGDQIAGDNVWTIQLDLPRSLRIGYKFTWGFPGDSWNGTEEWPGNQRLLEITDVNGDGFVYRRDIFGDESSNKDLSNSQFGTVDFTTDGDGDGLLEAQELIYTGEPRAPDALSTASPPETPRGLGPKTVPQGEDGTCPDL